MSKVVDAVSTTGLAGVLRKMWARSLAEAVTRAAADVGADVTFDPSNERMKAVLARVAERIKGIDDTTRERVKGYVAQGQEAGMSPGELANLIKADPSGAFNAARALTISRTEGATAYAAGSVLGWSEAGVAQVVIQDGEGCGWTEHDDPDLADGSIRDLDDYEANPIGHPRCTRSAYPHIPD